MSSDRSQVNQSCGPDTITVSTTDKAVLTAKRANLHVSIRGSSYFTGNAALTKAKEVGQLVSELKASGLEESAIQLKGVDADLSSGMLGRSSSVNYELRIHCSDLDRMADVVGIVTSQKNTKLHQIGWEYDGEEIAETECLVRCVEKANKRAQLISGALGVRLVGVLSCTDSSAVKTVWRQSAGDEEESFRQSVGAFRLAQATSEDFDTDFSHDKTIQVNVRVTYRISDFESAAKSD